MAESRRERNPAAVSLSGVSVSTTPPTAGTATIAVNEFISTPVSVATGKARVTVLNMGFVESGDEEEPITVNGINLQPGAPALVFEEVFDRVNNVLKKVPAITIVNAGGSRVRVTTEE